MGENSEMLLLIFVSERDLLLNMDNTIVVHKICREEMCHIDKYSTASAR
jgi:hypothetical protein